MVGMILDTKARELFGAHIVGAEAAGLIQRFVAA
jgi:pyruvate/2-oxoglutarate dehydrogenase complex dihydrolipoamide dehydrogenase (E3) component